VSFETRFAFSVQLPLGRFGRVFTVEMEEELAKYYQDKDARFYGLVRKEFMQVGLEFPDVNGLSVRLSKEKKVAGKGWVRDFCARDMG
jgi:hypothetical protein